jgi:hypothetical protein
MVVMYLFIFLDAAAYLILYKKIRDEPISILNVKKYLHSEPNLAFKVSLGTLYFITTFDLYLFITHVYSSTSMVKFIIDTYSIS